MTYIEEYYNWLKANPNKANHKLLVVYKKLVEDLKKPKEVTFYNEILEEQETHTYVFDEKRANLPIRFAELFCRHSKGKWAGKPVKLELWQKALIQSAFGFVDSETRKRKYKKVVCFVARKNGKSTLASILSLYMLTKDGEGGAEVYSVATKKEQAKIVWEEAVRMVKKSPALAERCRCLVTGLYYDQNDSFMKALASDSNSLDGLNTSFGIGDETHAWRDKNLLDVIYDSMSAREQPMFLEISTMGTTRGRVFDIEYNYCEDIIKGYEGLNEIKDETLLPIIYELDNTLEYLDEEKWYKANPSLGSIKSVKDLRDKVIRAKNNPLELTNLLCKDFNIRQNENDTWLNFDVVNNENTFEMADIYNTYAVGGVDLSSTTDLTCATLLVMKNNVKYVMQQYFIPSERLEYKIKEDKIPYDKWEKRGLITICDGAKVNYSDVTRWFVDMAQEYKLSPYWVGYDPWNSGYWVEEMKSAGFNMVEVRQGARTLSNPMKTLEADLLEKNLNYNNNPITKWCLCNTSVKRDENDNIRPIKGDNQKNRIDGAVSLIIAYAVLYENLNEYLSLQGGK